MSDQQAVNYEPAQELPALDNRLQNLEAEIIRLTQERDEANGRCWAALNALSHRNAEFSAIERDLQVAIATIVDLKVAAHTAEENRANAMAMLNAIHNSTTWRGTHHLRKLLMRQPTLARTMRRTLKILWWILSGQLSAKIRAHRQLRSPTPTPSEVKTPSESINSTPVDASPLHREPGCEDALSSFDVGPWAAHAPLLSLIVAPTAKDPDTIVSNLLPRILENAEIISPELVQRHAPRHPALRYMSVAAESTEQKTTELVQASFGKYLGFISDDDIDTDFFRKALQTLEEGQADAVVRTKSDVAEGSERALAKLMAGQAIIRRSVWDAVGGLNAGNQSGSVEATTDEFWQKARALDMRIATID